jgi:predicted ATP-dependent endonuclease of OLD family
MKLYKLKINNFRKLHDVEIEFADATFLIGANNVGKSSVLTALELLLGKETKIDYSTNVSKRLDNGSEVSETGDIIIEAEFRNVQSDILNERGFNKNRLFTYTTSDSTDIYYGFRYRLRVDQFGKSHREIKLHKQEIKEKFESCQTFQDFINQGITEDKIRSVFPDVDLSKKINTTQKTQLDKIVEMWDVKTDDDDWFENPGGFSNVILSRLPDFLLIPAESKTDEIVSVNGSMFKVLNSLFCEVREASDHYSIIKEELLKLASEMDPKDLNSRFGELMSNLNEVVSGVFPTATIDVKANLSEATVLKPTFDIKMTSNVTTAATFQGTGMIRSVVFALLKFRKAFEDEQTNHNGLIIGFEEPELYLHPNAANAMRDIIYELATKSGQIIATTHSPYMINLDKKPNLVLNNLCEKGGYSQNVCFNASAKFNELQENDKTRVKMIQKMDDYVSRVFFASKVIIVEGDTEDIVFKKTIEVMPEAVKKVIDEKYQIIKATGKATIVSFVKYLKSMGVDVFVVHDEDSNSSGANVFNQSILHALGDDASKRYMMHDCIEDVLDYSVPSSDKPYCAYEKIKDWKTWSDVPTKWIDTMKKVFSDFASQL